MPDAPPRLPISILLVDDQRAILSGVSALIESEAPCMRVVGRARCAGQALALARGTAPDIVVLDADLAGEDGLRLIPVFRADCHAAVVVFTCLSDPEVRRRAQRLGAEGFVLKTAPGEELLAAIRRAAS